MTPESKGIAAASVAVLTFLFWLIYFREPVGGDVWTLWLPHLNASLNATTATLLVAGWISIKKGRTLSHIRFMSLAVAASALFLLSYCTYHYHHGHTTFGGTGWIRYVYFPLLISHILLSIIQVPLIGFTLLFALKKRYSKHKRVARWTLPIWLYVSVTGVLVFFFLRLS